MENAKRFKQAVEVVREALDREIALRGKSGHAEAKWDLKMAMLKMNMSIRRIQKAQREMGTTDEKPREVETGTDSR